MPRGLMSDATTEEGTAQSALGAAGQSQTQYMMAEHNIEAQKDAQQNQMLASEVSTGLTLTMFFAYALPAMLAA